MVTELYTKPVETLLQEHRINIYWWIKKTGKNELGSPIYDYSAPCVRAEKQQGNKWIEGEGETVREAIINMFKKIE